MAAVAPPSHPPSRSMTASAAAADAGRSAADDAATHKSVNKDAPGGAVGGSARNSGGGTDGTTHPPPLSFVALDADARLPRPIPPSDPELRKEAEALVAWAVGSKHEYSPGNCLGNDGAGAAGTAGAGAGGGDNEENETNPALLASQKYRTLTTLLARRAPTPLFHAVLHAIITANAGRELNRLVTQSKLHAQLIHLVMKLDPFVPLVGEGEGERGMEGLRGLDRARRERRRRSKLLAAGNAAAGGTNAADATTGAAGSDGAIDTSSPTPTKSNRSPVHRRPTVQIAEPSIRHKEDAKYIIPALPYFTYQIADAHLHLLVTLVSNNSIMGRSVVRSLWGLLSDFGGRWTEWAHGSLEGERKRRRLRRRKSGGAPTEERAGKAEREGAESERAEVEPPVAKRRKVDEVHSKPQAATPRTPSNAASITEGGGADEAEPEGERPVPGMSGLSVEFVRDAFYKDTDEEISSDRLASGRVRRILLALLNVFRLCPRSKTDLLSIASAGFPHHKTCPPTLYKWYAHQCLQLVRLSPTFEGPILGLFVDKALDMDVEIKISDRGLVTLDNASSRDDEVHFGSVSQALFGSESASPAASKKRSFHQISHDSLPALPALPATTGPAGAMHDAPPPFDESDQVLEISERLDALMAAIYGRLVEATAFDPTSLASAAAAVLGARRIHRHLDGVFDEKVRTTDRSKFVQFAFFVLFGRENDALEAAGRLMAEREREQQRKENPAGDGVPSDMADVGPLTVTDPLYRGFSAKLIEYFYDPGHGDVPRQTAACYLASFVSRAKYVCPETVCECIAALLRWAEVYLAEQPGEGDEGAATPARGRGVRRLSSTASLGRTQHACEMHGLFYTACQAAFYMMCFRGAEAVGYYRKACQHRHDPDSPYADPDSVDIGPRRWKNVCGHALQPLKYCLESVRVEFLHLAEDLDIFVLDPTNSHEEPQRDEVTKFIDHLWDTSMAKGGKQMPHGPGKIKSATPKKRRRTIISTAATQEKKRLDGGVGGLGRGSNPLDSFFPFDPYLLQKSYEHVHPYYRNWEDCILAMDDGAGKDDNEEEAVFADDASSSVSDLEDEEDEEREEIASEDDESDDEDDGDRPSKSAQSPIKSPTGVSLHEEENLEMEIRRSRAMSTGSQCSW